MPSPIVSSQINKSFQIDVRRVVERLRKGRVGKHIEEVMRTDEVQQYFARELVLWAVNKAQKMPLNVKQEFQDMTTAELLWKNLTVNLSINIFNNALAGWFAESDKDFDDVIIDLVTVDTVKMVIDAVKQAFEEKASQLQGRVIPFQTSYSGSPLVN